MTSLFVGSLKEAQAGLGEAEWQHALRPGDRRLAYKVLDARFDVAWARRDLARRVIAALATARATRAECEMAESELARATRAVGAALWALNKSFAERVG